jgi:hypothetical protein
MKLQIYVDRLNESKEYKSFHKQFSDAFVAAGFFILDFEEGKNIHQIDYYVPSKKKIAAFTLDAQVTYQLLDMLSDKVPEKLEIKTKVDLDQLKGILQDEMKNRNITEEIKKIIAVLQEINGKKIWNLNCILSGMGILNAHVEDESRSVLKMEKKSFMDVMKKMPAAEFKKQLAEQNKAKGVQPSQVQEQVQIKETVNEAKEKLKKLDELEKEIEREKAEIEKEIESPAQKAENSKATKPSKKKSK